MTLNGVTALIEESDLLYSDMWVALATYMARSRPVHLLSSFLSYVDYLDTHPGT